MVKVTMAAFAAAVGCVLLGMHWLALIIAVGAVASAVAVD